MVTAIIGPSGCGKSTLLRTINRMNDFIDTFKIEGEIIKVSPGPIVTMYELQPAPGIKASKIIFIST